MRILIVEDNNDFAQGMARLLQIVDPTVSAHAVSDLRSAVSYLEEGHEVDVALVDLALPDAAGTEAPERLRLLDPELVMIVISGDSSADTTLSLIRLGIQDYIPKHEVTADRILRTIGIACERYVREQQLNRLACTDQLTGTLNRRGLLAALEEARNAARNLHASSALLTIDIDRFKSINDSHGHPVGDLVLTQACQRISQSVRRHDIVGRAGGDEIWVIMNGVNKHANVAAMGNNLLRRFAAPIRASGEVSITVSIGMALTPDHAITVNDWIDCSDLALYAAKRNGRNQCVMYNERLRPFHSAACDCS